MKLQHASRIYGSHFSDGTHSNEDISLVLDRAESGELVLPRIDLLCGGFPCQDYSVARPLPQASGIEGKKGVLWWEIQRAIKLWAPRVVFLENVDRLLKSPARRRGRDFAIMLACLADLGYWAEWRVVNAADYGFPQKRRRVFILAYNEPPPEDPHAWMATDGVLAKALSASVNDNEGATSESPDVTLNSELYVISETFGSNDTSPFANAGVMVKGDVWTRRVTPTYEGPFATLGSVLQPDDEVPREFFIDSEELSKWIYLKGAKSELRRHKDGHEYFYSEGGIPFPDSLDQPARTILTGEGGRTPSRFKHVIETRDGVFRRLTPTELERLNGFPDDWTAGVPVGRRAFLMGNALVVGIVARIAGVLQEASRRSVG
jgi:DNA (cytosine-5)-methyltransferase 1